MFRAFMFYFCIRYFTVRNAVLLQCFPTPRCCPQSRDDIMASYRGMQTNLAVAPVRPGPMLGPMLGTLVGKMVEFNS